MALSRRHSKVSGDTYLRVSSHLAKFNELLFAVGREVTLGAQNIDGGGAGSPKLDSEEQTGIVAIRAHLHALRSHRSVATHKDFG